MNWGQCHSKARPQYNTAITTVACPSARKKPASEEEAVVVVVMLVIGCPVSTGVGEGGERVAR